MYSLMIVAAVALLGVTSAGVAAVTLSFRTLRRNWLVLVGALPALAVGAFYTVGFLVGRRPFSPFFVIFWFLLLLGAIGVVRWYVAGPGNAA